MGLATVFGGSGFVGRYVVAALARRGWSVNVAVRRPDSALFLKTAGTVGQVTPVAANVRDRASIERALAGASAVINLVGILFQSGAQRFQSVHVEGAGEIAAAAKRAGARHLVHVSAIGADPEAQSHYARTKGEGEARVLAAFAEAVILRPSIVFGPEDDFFNRFARMSRLSPFLPLIGGGKTRFQPVYAGDVAEAVAVALERPDCRGKIYELGGPAIYTFEELLRLMMKETKQPRLLIPLPFALASLQAWFLEWLPVPPLTVDQVRLLRRDNVVGDGQPGLGALGIEAKPVELVIPSYLDRYRPRGHYDRS